MTPEELARRFHETYERLAPAHGYRTRGESAVPWEQVPEANRNLMVAVCGDLLSRRIVDGRPMVSLPAWMLDRPNEFFLVAVEPDGTAHIDGGHSETGDVAKARHLFEHITVIRPPEGTKYVMVGVAEVPPFRGSVNEEAIRTLNKSTLFPTHHNGDTK